MHRKPFVRAALAAAAAVIAAGGPAAPVAATASPAAPAAPAVDLVGHGLGHGRGMGQYGAYGYAADMGWTYQQILAHFYGGTALSSPPAGSPQAIGVRLDEVGGAADQTFLLPAAAAVSGLVAAPAALRVHANGDGTYSLYGQSACTAPPSSLLLAGAGTAVTISAPAPDDSAATTIALCLPSGPRPYQGSFTISAGGTVDTLPLDQYVAGVVPREEPASWGSVPNGEAALQAQAVAARSYALAYAAANGGQICDSQSCQVYGGDAAADPAIGGYAVYSDQAATSTAGQVLTCEASSSCGPAGSAALSEYSSSTGGYSAGGAFPAVVDAGDATASNPDHDWTASVPVAAIQAAYPQIGALAAVRVTARNGLGDLGGRVLRMVVAGSQGSVTVTGAGFAGTLGLRSDWFALSPPPGRVAGGDGYWVAGSDGAVFAFGAAPALGSEAGHPLNQPVVGFAPTAGRAGYWLVAADGGIFTFGDAAFLGSEGGHPLNRPVVGLASSPARGYWLVAADGGVFTFGDAAFFGSTGAQRLNQPVVGVAATADGRGYWLVASDGGIFTFGDAGFFGSTGAQRLNQPIVGMVPTADGRGYWLVAADGGVFTFGDAAFLGSVPGEHVADTVAGLGRSADGNGYWLVGARGAVYPFGDAPPFGDLTGSAVAYTGRVVGIAGHQS
ncbi:MAG: SpoIID/LytB domain-containing protein [Acidimicrobiales bacterium]